MKKQTRIGAMMALLLLMPGLQLKSQWLLTGNAGTTSTQFIGTTDVKPFKIRTFNQDRITISEDGFVTIGPAPALGFIGAGSFAITASSGSWSGMYTNGSTSSIKPFYGYAIGGSASAYHYYEATSGSWRLNMLAADRLVVTQFGLVGINKTTPTEMLDVVGNGKFTGSLSSNSLTTNNIGANTISTNSINVSSIVGPVTTTGTSTTNGNSVMNGDLVVNGNIDFNNLSPFYCNQIQASTTSSAAAISGTAAAAPGSPNLLSIGVYGSDNGKASNYGLWSAGKMMALNDVRVMGDVIYNGYLTQVSDAKFKTNITPLKNSLDLIMQLKPSEYIYKKDDAFKDFKLKEGIQQGFIAQEIEKVFPNLVINQTQHANLEHPTDEMINFKTVNYVGLIPFLTKAIQEQQTIIDEQKGEIEQFKSHITDLNEKVTRLEALMENHLEGNTELNNNVRLNQLYVNNPNPFDKQTTIRYYISNTVINASILLMDMNGKVINTFELTQKGEGSITLQADQLTSGLYSYILMIDGNVADAKKMVLNK